MSGIQLVTVTSQFENHQPENEKKKELQLRVYVRGEADLLSACRQKGKVLPVYLPVLRRPRMSAQRALQKDCVSVLLNKAQIVFFVWKHH